MAESKLALITFLSPGEVPDNSLPSRPNYPNQGLPGGPNYPGNALPGGGYIATLPVFPFDPTRPSNELPGSQPGMDNELPRPGKRYVVKWLACTGLILVPDNELPSTPPPTTDNELPETAEPK